MKTRKRKPAIFNVQLWLRDVSPDAYLTPAQARRLGKRLVEDAMRIDRGEDYPIRWRRMKP